MPSSGISAGYNYDPWGTAPKPPIAPTSQFGNPATFTAGANTQANDYDTIMKNYADLITKSNNNPITAPNISPQSVNGSNIAPSTIPGQTPIAPQTIQGSYNTNPSLTPYKQTGDVTKSLSDLSGLAETGGYTPQGIADIRERSISPTRSIYANAQQNIERQRALAGGYSPNFNATQAQLARDESSQIGDINTNVNAGIAQNVAANKLSAAPSYASASGNANAAEMEANQRNSDIINQINEANTSRNLSVNSANADIVNRANEAGMSRTADLNKSNADIINQINQANATRNASINEGNANRDLTAKTTNASNILTAGFGNRNAAIGAISGMTSLYGTTPALTNTFGNQVVQAGQLKQGQQQLDQQKQRDTFGLAGYRS